jgi:hypothetical protein
MTFTGSGSSSRAFSHAFCVAPSIVLLELSVFAPGERSVLRMSIRMNRTRPTTHDWYSPAGVAPWSPSAP